MMTCLYKGEPVYSIDIERADGNSNYELEKELRTAGLIKQLVCPDCGSPVLLRAGEIRVPYFAHWKGFGMGCSYDMYGKTETPAHRQAKKLLYSFFRNSYPQAMVAPEYRLPNGRRADVYVDFGDGRRLAIEFQASNLSYGQWKQRHDDYASLGIKDLWLLFGSTMRLEKKVREIELRFMDQYIMRESPERMTMFLDVEKQELLMIKTMIYVSSLTENVNDQLFIKSYPLNSVIITPDGQVQPCFYEQFKIAREEYLAAWRKNERVKAETVESRRINESQRDKRRGLKKNWVPPTMERLRIMVEGALEGNEKDIGELIYTVKGVGPYFWRYLVNRLEKTNINGDKRAKILYDRVYPNVYMPDIWGKVEIRETTLREVAAGIEVVKEETVPQRCNECRFRETPIYNERCINRKDRFKNCGSFSPKI